MPHTTKSLLVGTAFLFVILAFTTPSAEADSFEKLTLFTQPMANVLPLPTSPFTYGLNLCAGPLNGCLINPIASLTSNGTRTFTVSDAGFNSITAYIQNLNPPIGQTLVPFVSYQVSGVTFSLRNFYQGHFSEYPGPEDYIAEIVFDVPPISEVVDAGNGLWVARGPDGKEVTVLFSLVGPNLVPEPNSFLLLGFGILPVVAVKWSAQRKKGLKRSRYDTN